MGAVIVWQIGWFHSRTITLITILKPFHTSVGLNWLPNWRSEMKTWRGRLKLSHFESIYDNLELIWWRAGGVDAEGRENDFWKEPDKRWTKTAPWQKGDCALAKQTNQFVSLNCIDLFYSIKLSTLRKTKCISICDGGAVAKTEETAL